MEETFPEVTGLLVPVLLPAGIGIKPGKGLLLTKFAKLAFCCAEIAA